MKKTNFSLSAVIMLWVGFSSIIEAQNFDFYNSGSPILQQLYVNAITGNDENSGLSPSQAVRTLQAALDLTPVNTTVTGFQINLAAGVYPYDEAHSNYYSDHHGSFHCPLILKGTGNRSEVKITGGLMLNNFDYIYIQNLTIESGEEVGAYNSNNVLHIENSRHVLVRNLVIKGDTLTVGEDNPIQEDVKTNQVQHFYLDSCHIVGTRQTAVDLVSTQYGYVRRCNIHRSGGRGMYMKGGSAYLLISENQIYDAREAGIQTGEGTLFAAMVAPWIHYECYDVKVVNNVIHDIFGAGLAVAGGFNVLMAHNTLYRIGLDRDDGWGLISSSLVDIVHGSRSHFIIDEIGEEATQNITNQFHEWGGWGPWRPEDVGAGGDWIPNQNINIYNNIFYNPPGSGTHYNHIRVNGPVNPDLSTNIPIPSNTDNGVYFAGNIIWNQCIEPDAFTGSTNGSEPGCISGSSCDLTTILAQNFVNTIQPQLTNPAQGDFRPLLGGNLNSIPAQNIPDFSWNEAPPSPSTPEGTLTNQIIKDFLGNERVAPGIAGAFSPESVSKTWNGSNSDWTNPTNWIPAGIPSILDDILIPSSTAAFPSIESFVMVKNISINEGGALHISPAGSLTVSGNLLNNAGNAGLVLESDASGTASLLHFSDEVDATYERYLTGNSMLTALDYHLVAAPVSDDINLGVFAGHYVFQFDQNTQSWESLGSNSSTSIPTNVGYLVYFPEVGTSCSFMGRLQNGSYSPALVLNESDAFALLPNPYPCAVDWDAISGWTKTNIRNALWVWNPLLNQYAAYSSGVAVNGGSRYIPGGQSFFVQSTTPFPVLAMNNDIRLHNTQPFYKEFSNASDVLYIKVSTSTFGDETAIRFSTQGSKAFDELDIDKLFGAEEAPGLYSILGEGRPLSINTLPYVEETIATIGFEYNQNENITISFYGIDSFDPKVTILLEDNLTGQIINIRENNSYTFSHTVTNEPKRFNMHFLGVTAVDDKPQSGTNHIWSDGNTLYLSFPELQRRKALYELFDLNGRLLESRVLSLETIQRLRPQASGIVIARVSLANQVYVNKLFIR